ncbi:Uncharacterised protein [Vibrio cholerae]|nr:Uncharacterised protein [Vibrio cholerae]CSC09006.1 Uncharacterised protein [Vibrio cholerae]
MARDHIAKLLFHGQNWVQRVHRTLKYHRHFFPTERLHALITVFQDVFTVEDHLATSDERGRLMQAHQREGNGGFTTAGFTRKAKHLAGG